MGHPEFVSSSTARPVRAILFDTFGTVVDWRSGIARDVEAFARKYELNIDPGEFADRWRDRYQPAMEQVRSGRRGYVPLDQLHMENLRHVLAHYQFTADDFAPEDLTQLNHAWHRLDPWPDSVEGLTNLRQRYIIGPLSNANLSLLVNMAKRAGLPWDVVIGSDITMAYKPQPQAYTRAADLLGVHPGELMLTAAHNTDLAAARQAGLATAFVPRRTEFGPGQTSDLTPVDNWDIVASDFVSLAHQLTSAS